MGASEAWISSAKQNLDFGKETIKKEFGAKC